MRLATYAPCEANGYQRNLVTDWNAFRTMPHPWGRWRWHQYPDTPLASKRHEAISSMSAGGNRAAWICSCGQRGGYADRFDLIPQDLAYQLWDDHVEADIRPIRWHA